MSHSPMIPPHGSYRIVYRADPFYVIREERLDVAHQPISVIFHLYESVGQPPVRQWRESYMSPSSPTTSAPVDKVSAAAIQRCNDLAARKQKAR